MAFVDPEAAEAALAGVQERAAATADQPGAVGAVGRAGDAYTALVRWLMAERNADTHFPDITDAAARICGAFMASVALSVGRPGAQADLVSMIGVEAAGYALAMTGDDHVQFRAPVHEGRPQ